MKVESVQINLQVTHVQSGQVGVELTSPSGTKSILLNINNALLMASTPDSDLDVTLTSHAFYGENASGTWTLKLIDGKADTVSGTLDQWAINILGH
jgi:subtilisin-like proprotein convertase family protein